VDGGDTTSSPALTISVTALGRSERVPGRSGARPGDVLVVTGPLGAAAAGLSVLERGLEGFDDLVRAHNRPPYRLDAARDLGPVAHAMLDLSDGIASDAQRIAERSGVKLVIDVDRLPLAPRLEEVGDEPFWTLGEDYELLAALAPEDAMRAAYPFAGRVEPGAGVELLQAGRPIDLTGWDHFRP
jgi:thiamine-monophosphate kinase